jgi:ABC-type dipeptide/oligopeptide/nickel transport system ATPase component
MTTNDAIVTCENLVKLYRIDDLEVMALQGLDLTIKRGEVMALVGSFGSQNSLNYVWPKSLRGMD